MTSTLAAKLCLALVCLPSLALASGQGGSAPEFTKTSLDGATISRSDYDGRVLVLFLFGYS